MATTTAPSPSPGSLLSPTKTTSIFSPSKTARRRQSQLEDFEFENDGQEIPHSKSEISETVSKISTARKVLKDSRGVAMEGIDMVIPRFLRRRREEDISDDDDDMYTQDGVGGLKNRGKGKLSKREVRNIRLQVYENMGLSEAGDAMTPMLKFQQNIGVLRLRIFLAEKRMLAEREKSSCPAARELVDMLRFEVLVGMLIALNSVNMFMGAMTDPGKDDPVIIQIFENAFVFIFLLEWTLRILAYSWVWVFWSPMNFFDTTIVWGTGVMVTWVMPPLGVEATILQRFSALRVLRLGRIIRAIRIMPQFRELWMLVDGMLSCFYMLFWACLIIGIVHYMFAIFILETITKSDSFKDDDFVQEHMGSMGDAMFTLFQIMTFDSWNVIVRPIIIKMPETIFIFALFVGVAGIVLFNLMTAIVIQNALVDAPKKDEEALAFRKELETKKWETQLRNMFLDLDEDGTGSLSATEFEAALEDVTFARTMRLLDVDLEELPDIFEILNDGTGEINVEGFITGLMRMQGPAMSRDTLHASKRLSTSAELVGRLKDSFADDGLLPLDRCVNDLGVVHEDFTKVHMLIKKHIEQLNHIGLRRTFNATSSQLAKVHLPTFKEAQKMDRRAQLAERQQKLAMLDPTLKLPPSSAPPGVFYKTPSAAWYWKRQQAERQEKKQERAELKRLKQEEDVRKASKLMGRRKEGAGSKSGRGGSKSGPAFDRTWEANAQNDKIGALRPLDIDSIIEDAGLGNFELENSFDIRDLRYSPRAASTLPGIVPPF